MRKLWLRYVEMWVGILSLGFALACVRPQVQSLQEIKNRFEQETPDAAAASPGTPALPLGVARFEARDGKVTAAFEGASLDAVAHLFAGRAGVSCVLPRPVLKGTVTCVLENADARETLARLATEGGYTAEMKGETLVVGMPSSAGREKCTEEVALSHVSAQEALDFLANVRNGLPSDVAFGPSPGSSSIVITGPCGGVERATDLLDAVDKAAPTVSIQALVVKYADDVSSSMGPNLGGQSGKFSNLAWNPGNFSFSYNVLDKLPDAFFGRLELLAADGMASIVSRPYIAVRSGREAEIALKQEEYFIAQSSAGGVVSSKLESIPAGVVLKIKPVVAQSGQIELSVEIEQSVFTPPPSGSSWNSPYVATVERNQAKTRVTVKDGQTLIIGGLVREVKSKSNYGFPGFRHIPLWNYFFSHREKETKKEELVVYITPRVS